MSENTNTNTNATSDFHSICSAVQSQLEARDRRRDMLARRIQDTAEKAMKAARARSMRVGDHMLEYVEVTAPVSQWACGSYMRTRRETHLLLDYKWLEEQDLGFFDGNNMQHQQGPAIAAGHTVRRATVRELCSVAKALPEAIADMFRNIQMQASSEAEAASTAIDELALQAFLLKHDLNVMKIVRAPGGTARRDVDVQDVRVPDLWQAIENMTSSDTFAYCADEVKETWHLAHDLLWNLRQPALNRKIEHWATLLCDIARQTAELERARRKVETACLNVDLLDDGNTVVLTAGLTTALEYLANDIYQGDDGMGGFGDWSNATKARVRVI